MTIQHETAWVPRLDSFGARLALVRWRMGWNQKEAALATGVKPQSWRDWEILDRLPRRFPEIAGQIADRTGVDEYWLMTGKTNDLHPDGPDGGLDVECATRDSNPQPSDPKVEFPPQRANLPAPNVIPLPDRAPAPIVPLRPRRKAS